MKYYFSDSRERPFKIDTCVAKHLQALTTAAYIDISENIALTSITGFSVSPLKQSLHSAHGSYIV